MKSLNKVALIGVVGKEPDIRSTGSGMAVANFSLATDKKHKDKEKVTQWHACVAFGKLAEVVKEYVGKGAPLYVEGEIQYAEYEKDGEKRLSTKIVINDLILLGSSNKSPIEKPSAKHPHFSNPASFYSEDIPF